MSTLIQDRHTAFSYELTIVLIARIDYRSNTGGSCMSTNIWNRIHCWPKRISPTTVGVGEHECKGVIPTGESRTYLEDCSTAIRSTHLTHCVGGIVHVEQGLSWCLICSFS